MAASPVAGPAWHERYRQQARWTADLRRFLGEKASLPRARRVLEVGSGTGVILAGLVLGSSAAVFGIDLDLPSLRFSRSFAPAAHHAQAGAHFLPFPDGAFDLTCCHFLLLWTPEPEQVLREMRRVTRPGGAVLAFAEPDYGGRIDYPPVLAELGRWQTGALADRGADPLLGRRLAGLLAAAGLRSVESGVLGGNWTGLPDRQAWEMEWETLASDLAGTIPAARLEELRRQDWQAWQQGQRVLYVPTFYAWGVR